MPQLEYIELSKADNERSRQLPRYGGSQTTLHGSLATSARTVLGHLLAQRLSSASAGSVLLAQSQSTLARYLSGYTANNPFGLASLCSLRRSDLHALKELWLRNCYLKPEGGKFSSSDALQLFRFSTSSLRTLRLSTTRLTVDCQPLLECTKATLKHRFPEATLQ